MDIGFELLIIADRLDPRKILVIYFTVFNANVSMHNKETRMEGGVCKKE